MLWQLFPMGVAMIFPALEKTLREQSRLLKEALSIEKDKGRAIAEANGKKLRELSDRLETIVAAMETAENERILSCRRLQKQRPDLFDGKSDLRASDLMHALDLLSDQGVPVEQERDLLSLLLLDLRKLQTLNQENQNALERASTNLNSVLEHASGKDKMYSPAGSDKKKSDSPSLILNATV
ncbi:MAG: hypothetical protein CMN76_05020 [Spirochaetaceae bacterium]|nr:hypothetical protein [Spirochaetaceae bacterium]|tara:strand:+ start:25012 stop:25557 length:546 start_codon:yes stop_codon:yes gene_type:complete